MSDNVKPTYPKSSVKSGNENSAYAEKILGGMPPKKSVDAIEAENTVKKAPGSVAK
jgi:hypothetical protein